MRDEGRNDALEAEKKYKTAVESANEYIENFDILETITNVGNDEVFTPRKTCEMILDSLPEEVWHNPNYKWLNPATKNGVFEREIAIRLDNGLKDKIPDTETRRKHILQNMIFAIGQTRFTANVARRTLYYCSEANRKCDGIKAEDGHYVNGYAIGNGTWFNDEEGNIKTPNTNHTFIDANGNVMPDSCVGDARKKFKCKFCGINGTSLYNDANQREKYAYEFIHFKNEKLIEHLQARFFGGNKNMKFDIIIGNPPYQLSDGGGANGKSSLPIYNIFVEQAINLKPKYISMIIPSRWFAGGKGLDDFRKRMLNDNRVERIDDFINSKDCFPTVDISGGICFFLWNSEKKDQLCSVYTHNNGVTNLSKRSLNEFEIFIRDCIAVKIIKKLSDKINLKENNFSNIVSSRCPYGLGSDYRGEISKAKNKEIKLHSSKGISYIDKNEITIGSESIGSFKIMMSKATSEHANIPDKDGKFKVVSRVQIIGPGEVCTDSYLVIGQNYDENEINNILIYIKTKFFRYLLQQALTSISISKDKFQFIPLIDFSKPSTDKDLYNLFDLTEDEVYAIENTIREMK